MSITSLSDWGKVELAAQTHELNHVESPKVPEPYPMSIGDNLAAYAVQCAELKARINRLEGGIGNALLWLRLGENNRARQSLSQVQIDM